MEAWSVGANPENQSIMLSHLLRLQILSDKQNVMCTYTIYKRIQCMLSYESPPSWSEVHKVKLSRSNCMMSVESLYESSETLSSSAMASSKAVRAILHASSGLAKTS